MQMHAGLMKERTWVCYVPSPFVATRQANIREDGDWHLSMS